MLPILWVIICLSNTNFWGKVICQLCGISKKPKLQLSTSSLGESVIVPIKKIAVGNGASFTKCEELKIKLIGEFNTIKGVLIARKSKNHSLVTLNGRIHAHTISNCEVIFTILMKNCKRKGWSYGGLQINPDGNDSRFQKSFGELEWYVIGKISGSDRNWYLRWRTELIIK